MHSKLLQEITGKSVLFITTKNLDYIRNTQEIALLEKHAASCTVIGSASPSYPKRLLSVWTRLFTLSMKPFDVVFAGFSPQLILPLFAFRFRRARLVEDFFISFYDTLVFDRQKFSEKSLPGRFFKWLDTVAIRRAALVICDTNAHGAYFAEEFGLPKNRLETLYLTADTTIYYPRMAAAKSDGGKGAPFTVLYFGSILPLQGLPVILHAVERLQGEPDLRFVIIGPIPADVSRPTGPHIHYVNWLSQEELAREIAKADLCLAGHFHKDIQKAHRTIPGKAYIYEAMKKPMILGDNPATRELESTWLVPIRYVPMGDGAALADAILDFRRTLAPSQN